MHGRQPRFQELGVIEGYFGRPWRHDERKRALKVCGFSGSPWFHYAPRPMPICGDAGRTTAGHHGRGLADLSAHCCRLGVRFGVGLSPVQAVPRLLQQREGLRREDPGARRDRNRRPGDPVRRRAAMYRIWRHAKPRSSTPRWTPLARAGSDVSDLLLRRRDAGCRLGERPTGYLEDLGRRLDPRVGVYWTGRDLRPRSSARATSRAWPTRCSANRRLWDNYPVNDGGPSSPSSPAQVHGAAGRDRITRRAHADQTRPLQPPQASATRAPWRGADLADMLERDLLCGTAASIDSARIASTAATLRGRRPSDGRRGRTLARRRRHDRPLGRGCVIPVSIRQRPAAYED